MAKILQIAHSGSLTLAADGTVRYAFATNGVFDANTTQLQRESTYRIPGVMSGLRARVTANTASTSTVLRIEVNNSNVNGILTITTGQTGLFFDTGPSDTISAGDEVVINITPANGSGSITFNGIGEYFEATGDTTFRSHTDINATLSTASATRYFTFGGRCTFRTVEDPVKIQTGGTHSYMFTYVVGNTKPANTIFTSRKNAADGAMTFTVGATLSGFFEDLTNVDTITSGDSLGYKIVTGAGVGNIIIMSMGSHFTTTDRKIAYVNRNDNSSIATTNLYRPLTGNIENATEANQTFPVATGTFTGIWAQASFNTKGTNTLVGLRINGVTGTLVATITAGGTGVFTNTGTDAVVDGDLCCVEIAPGGSGFLAVETVGTVFQAPAPPAFTPTPQMHLVQMAGGLM